MSNSDYDAPGDNSQAIISICVPTYNRADCLDSLLGNLEVVKKNHGRAVEICISNNHSTDHTSEVIERWSTKLAFHAIEQAENIGATRNSYAVTGVANGKWLMIVGDDDAIIPANFSRLLSYLLTAKAGDWVLAGVADPVGHEYLLGSLKPGNYEAKTIRRRVMQTGLYRYGFIGMHVFPSTLKDEFASMTLEQAQPWPHLALFLRHIQHAPVHVFTTPVVQQAGGGSVLFWAIYDMAHIKLRKLNIIAEARVCMPDNSWYADLLLLRELYLARDIRTLLFWKALEPEDFRNRALHEYGTRYQLLRPAFRLLTLFHGLLLLTTYLLPASAMRAVLGLVGQRSWMRSYEEKKDAMSEFNGIERGV